MPLYHQGDCNILALVPDGSLYAEEFYADGYIAQYQILDGVILAAIDEDAGQREIVPFQLPTPALFPDNPSNHPLNYRGLRFQGLREEEQIQEWIMPLSVMEKMPLLAALGWALPPMLLLGIAESQVLAQAQIADEWLICRRLRLAYALAERRYDEAGLPYDYDSRLLYLLHSYTGEQTPALHEALHFAGTRLERPMDMIYHDGLLVVAEGGDSGRNACLRFWQKDS